MVGPYVCYACGKMTRGTREFPLQAVLEDDDGNLVWVGPDCHKKTRAEGGYQPTRGGPRLFFNQAQREAWLAKQRRHYPEEWGPSDNKRLTCVCGNPDPGHQS
jgi:hypothetical protein